MMSNLTIPAHLFKIANWGYNKKKKKLIFLCNLHNIFLRHWKIALTLFFPTFPFDPPENIRKPKVF